MSTPTALDVRSPEQWRDHLAGVLALRAIDAAIYDAYYSGEHPMQFATSKFREAFGNLFHAFADNWCQIVVDAPVERLQVVGFRVGGSISKDAWAIWQDNNLDRESVIAHTEAGKCGRAYLLVDPTDEDDGPAITVESSTQMVVVCDPGDRDERVAALKRWAGDDGYAYCTLYLPDQVLRFQSTETLDAPNTRTNGVEWAPRADGPAEVDNPLGVVPVIPLENKPGLLGEAHSDLDTAIPLQNAINKLCTDLIVTSEYGAFPQRVVTGIEVPKDPETGEPLEKAELKSAMSRLWTFRPPDVRVTSLPAADLQVFVNAIEMFVQHLAAQTRTPPHYLLGQVVNASGDALAAAEAGLVSKCEQKILYFSEPWEEAIALALQATGEDVDESDCEVVWAKPERIAQGQLVDAAVKKKSLGIPLPVIWAELGYSPEAVAEMTKELESTQQAELEAAAQAEAAQAREMLAGTPGEAVAPGEPAPAQAAPGGAQSPPPASPPPAAPPTT